MEEAGGVRGGHQGTLWGRAVIPRAQEPRKGAGVEGGGMHSGALIGAGKAGALGDRQPDAQGRG